MAERPFGPYRLVRQIAVGGMAEIHLAKARGIAGFEKYVALKMIHPNFAEDESFIQMLIDEAKISVQLQHVNIAHTFDLGRVGDTYYITMEFVDGADLYKLLRRGSELDLDMPLDVAAFISKEMLTGLDYAHGKRDGSGAALGIVHRDVSPQNVLVSHAGEIKVVDFGIAKATMKARQTAAGVIKGKYYYMSPEQAWGDVVDHRSDIFSAGIVLYEMITGQMLYLEEDLHRLLDLVRRADIAPPSRLRKDVPPELERIVMHALARNAGDRYASAADFATDLERFLHGYAPVFTAAKVASHSRRVLGEPQAIDPGSAAPPEPRSITHNLAPEDLVREADDLRDENSMIYQLGDMRRPSTVDDGLSFAEPTAPAQPRGVAPTVPPVPAPVPVAPVPAPGPPVASSVPRPAARVGAFSIPRPPTMPPPLPVLGGAAPLPRITTRAAGSTASPPLRRPDDALATAPPAGRARTPTTPAPPRGGRDLEEPTRELGTPAPRGPGRAAPARPVVPEPASPPERATPRAAAPPRQADESTRQIETGPAPRVWIAADDDDDVVEPTEMTEVPRFGGRGFLEAHTVADAGPALARSSDGDDNEPTFAGEADPARPERAGTSPMGSGGREFADEATVARAPGRASGAAAAALSGHNPTPSVSELRRPRGSRQTPTEGVTVERPSVLQSIVGGAGAEPMPARPSGAFRRASTPVTDPVGPPPASTDNRPTLVDAVAPQHAGPAGAAGSASSGGPAGPGARSSESPTLPPGYGPGLPLTQQPSTPGMASPWPLAGAPGGPPSGWAAGWDGGRPGPTPPPSVSQQLRLLEVDEIAPGYKIRGSAPRWLPLLLAALAAVALAAVTTWAVVRATRDVGPSPALLVIQTSPTGANVSIDGQPLAGLTPLTFRQTRPGARHELRIELAGRQVYLQVVEVPAAGGQVSVQATLLPMRGTLDVASEPSGAEIYIGGILRGRTPTRLDDLDVSSVRAVEMRYPDGSTQKFPVTWSSTGTASIRAVLGK